MSRRRSIKPWLHKASGYWCGTISGKREYLDRDYKVACRKLNELRAAEKRVEAGAHEWLDAPFVTLADAYLSDVEKRRMPNTYRANRYRLLRALKIIDAKTRVADIRKIHLARIEQTLNKSHSPTTIADTITAVQSVFNWAVKHDLLDMNPLIGYDKPSRRSRNRIITPEEFQALLRHSDVNFRRILIAARLTGCRPGELRDLQWDWVDLTLGLWTYVKHKTINTQRKPQPRIVPLPDPIWKLCHWLRIRASADSQHVFLNRHGKPYSKDSLVTKMARVRERAGIEKKVDENLCMYSARHTYATETVGKISDFELATLLGHTDNQMIKRYVHLNTDRLREIQRRTQANPRVQGND